MQRAIPRYEFDFSRKLVWDSADRMDEFVHLLENPPLHSVVVRIEAPMARAILDRTNRGNRPLNNGNVERLRVELADGDWELTGDTIKFSSDGRALDCQHRLEACHRSGIGFDTHAVFGLSEDVFDVLDRQRTRTAADILAIAGYKNPTMLAGAARWVVIIQERVRTNLSGGHTRKNRTLDPRKTLELLESKYKGLDAWVGRGLEVSNAYKGIPPSMVCGLLWCVSQGGHKESAEGFSHDWLHGNRNYQRNRGFDALQKRIAKIRGENNGHLNTIELCAMLVTTFNFWNAGAEPTPRALTWKRQWMFPLIIHDGEEFMRVKDRERLADTSLPGQKLRILAIMTDLMRKNGKIAISQAELGKLCNLRPDQAAYVLRDMVDNGQLYIDKRGGGPHSTPSEYRIGNIDKLLRHAAA